MRKLFAAFLFSLMIFSCSESDYTVKNNSSLPVTFKFSSGVHPGPHTLAPGATDSYNVRGIYLEYYKSTPDIVAYTIIDAYNAEFADNAPILMNIINLTDKYVKLTAPGFILDPTEEAADEILIYPDDTEDTYFTLSLTPPLKALFSITGPPSDEDYKYPATVKYNFDGTVLAVTVNY